MFFLTPILSAALFCATALAAPAPTTYNLITTHSGNADVHLHPLGYTENNEVAINSSTEITAFFDGDMLGVTNSNGQIGEKKYFHVNEDNSIAVSDSGTSGFSLDRTDIALNGKQEFVVCVDNRKLYIKEAPASCSQFTGVGVYAIALPN